jgi:hypothetical protein
MNNSVRLKENDGKYSVIKEGAKRALRVFGSKQEALDYIKLRNLDLVEETMDIIVAVPLIENTAPKSDCYQEECCGADCCQENPPVTEEKSEKLSLLARIGLFFNKIIGRA